MEIPWSLYLCRGGEFLVHPLGIEKIKRPGTLLRRRRVRWQDLREAPFDMTGDLDLGFAKPGEPTAGMTPYGQKHGLLTVARLAQERHDLPAMWRLGRRDAGIHRSARGCLHRPGFKHHDQRAGIVRNGNLPRRGGELLLGLVTIQMTRHIDAWSSWAMNDKCAGDIAVIGEIEFGIALGVSQQIIK